MKKILAIALITGSVLAVAPAEARGFFHGPHVRFGFGFGGPGCFGCAYYPPYYGPAQYPPYYPPYPPPPPPPPYYQPEREQWHVTRQQDETDYELPDSVLFALDSAQISTNADAVISQIAQAARDEPGATLIVEGHTDTSGEAAHNQQLSEARAEAVKRELAQQGVASNRISAEGLGERGLAVQTGPNVREQQNRRVIVRLMHDTSANRQDYEDDQPYESDR